MNWLMKEEPIELQLRRPGARWPHLVDRREKSTRAEASAEHPRMATASFSITLGTRKSVVGIARAAGAAYPDPADKTGKLYAVDVEPVKKAHVGGHPGGDQGGQGVRVVPPGPDVASVGHAGHRRRVETDRVDGRPRGRPPGGRIDADRDHVLPRQQAVRPADPLRRRLVPAQSRREGRARRARTAPARPRCSG